MTRPDYEAFLQYMCPGFQDTGLYIPIGDDTNICPNPILGANPKLYPRSAHSCPLPWPRHGRNFTSHALPFPCTASAFPSAAMSGLALQASLHRLQCKLAGLPFGVPVVYFALDQAHFNQSQTKPKKKKKRERGCVPLLLRPLEIVAQQQTSFS